MSNQTSPMNNSARRRILVYRIGQLGDTIIALPALWALRRYFPQAHLTLLSDVHSNANYVGANRVLPSKGLIDQWMAYQALDSRGNITALFALLRRLRRLRFDTLVYLAPQRRTSLQVWRDLAFFRLAGIRQFIGQRGFAPFPPRRPGESLPMLEQEADHLLQRLARSGIPVPNLGRGEMNLALTAAEYKGADSWLHTRVPGYSAAMRLVGVGPGSKDPSKVWPVERFGELGKRLIGELGLYPIVFGGPEDAALAARLVKIWGDGTNAAGALDIRPAAAALARCRLYVGNDTGTMHLAAAVGTPCVAVFSARDWPGRWFPYGTGHTVLRRTVACEGCLLQVCEREGLRCLKKIGVDEVLAACRETLSINV